MSISHKKHGQFRSQRWVDRQRSAWRLSSRSTPCWLPVGGQHHSAHLLNLIVARRGRRIRSLLSRAMHFGHGNRAGSKSPYLKKGPATSFTVRSNAGLRSTWEQLIEPKSILPRKTGLFKLAQFKVLGPHLHCRCGSYLVMSGLDLMQRQAQEPERKYIYTFPGQGEQTRMQ
jgi:hypothetical protein